MRALSLLLLVLLAGCSGTPLAELEDQYFQCTRDGAQGCDLIAEEVDRRHEAAEKRARHQRIDCTRPETVCVRGPQAEQRLRDLARGRNTY